MILAVAAHLEALTGQSIGDALDVMLAARAIKTANEIATLQESGRIADDIMTYTISQLGIGTTWAEVEKSVAHL